MYKSAHISDNGRYRHSLVRIWNDTLHPKIVCFHGLNPSTADAVLDDQTIRKEIAFGKSWGMDGLLKTNLYAWRETSPQKLFQAGEWHNIIGLPVNGAPAIVERIKNMSSLFVVCVWGTHASKAYAERIASLGQAFTEAAKAAKLPLFCLGLNQDGSPKHTCRLSLKSQRIPYGEPCP